jgi:hypothetical protein
VKENVMHLYMNVRGFQLRKKIRVSQKDILQNDNLNILVMNFDHLYGLVIRTPGYRFRDPSSIPGATRFP